MNTGDSIEGSYTEEEEGEALEELKAKIPNPKECKYRLLSWEEEAIHESVEHWNGDEWEYLDANWEMRLV